MLKKPKPEEPPSSALIYICNRCNVARDEITPCRNCNCPEFRLAVDMPYVRTLLKLLDQQEE